MPIVDEINKMVVAAGGDTSKVKTIADAVNELAIANGGTPSADGTIAGAVAAYNETIENTDEVVGIGGGFDIDGE